jgi:hypothetical protein
MLIFSKPKLLFVQIPKSGGTSMTSALRQAAARHDYQPLKHDAATHAGLFEAECVMGADWIDEARSFAILRNPWARLLSLWRFRIRRARERLAAGRPSPNLSGMTDTQIVEEASRLDFSNWLLTAEHHSAIYGISMTRKPQLSWCRTEDNRVKLDKILFLERMDFEYLRSLGIDAFPRLNAAEDTVDYRDHYSTQARKHVENWFSQDIEYGEYKF